MSKARKRGMDSKSITLAACASALALALAVRYLSAPASSSQHAQRYAASSQRTPASAGCGTDVDGGCDPAAAAAALASVDAFLASCKAVKAAHGYTFDREVDAKRNGDRLVFDSSSGRAHRDRYLTDDTWRHSPPPPPSSSPARSTARSPRRTITCSSAAAPTAHSSTIARRRTVRPCLPKRRNREPLPP